VEPRRKDDPGRFQRLQGEVDSMFLDLLRGERVPRYGKAAFRPSADVYFDKRQKAVVVKLDLSGVDSEQVSLEVEEGVLRVSGTRMDQRHPDAVYQQMEIPYGPFERMVMLPPEVDATKAHADYSNGFLEIVLPVRARSGRKKIPISPKDEAEGGRQI
jgi:HSP20 family protein